jgi:hypothetical protein
MSPDITAVYAENHTEPQIHRVGGKYTFINGKVSGAYSYQCCFNGGINRTEDREYCKIQMSCSKDGNFTDLPK